MIQLRPYQEDIVLSARAAFRAGLSKVVIVLATGGGKTVLGSFMTNGSSKRGLVCWWLVHRRELLMQASRTFHSLGIEHGLIMGGRSTDPNCRVQIGSIQTVARRLDRLPAPDLIVFDEAHHAGAAQWQQVWAAFPDAKVIGLTATPWRLDGKGLGNWYDHMVLGPSTADLIEAGSLSAYKLYAPSSPDMAGVATSMGDYKRDQLSTLMDKPSITGDAVQHYLRLCRGKRAVAFAVSIEHSRHIAEQFRAAGVPAEHVDGTQAHEDRDAAVARFVAGETLILTNAELFGEGFDVPAIEASILLRPTQSLSLYLQQVGRALRPAPGKSHAIILDHAGNSLRHGLPDDPREWSLEDRQKRKKGEGNGNPVRQCPECFFVYRPAPACPACGHGAPSQGRQVEQVEGVLQEVDPSVIRAQRKQEERRAKTVDDLIRLGQQRGYKNPAAWAQKFHAAREVARARYQPGRAYA